MQIAVDPSTDVWLRAFDLSVSQDVSVYDAIYIAISVVLDVKLITSDKKLAEKLSQPVRNRVVLLEEFVPP
jgi:predicted nucleic acid-binding protein